MVHKITKQYFNSNFEKHFFIFLKIEKKFALTLRLSKFNLFPLFQTRTKIIFSEINIAAYINIKRKYIKCILYKGVYVCVYVCICLCRCFCMCLCMCFCMCLCTQFINFTAFRRNKYKL